MIKLGPTVRELIKQYKEGIVPENIAISLIRYVYENEFDGTMEGFIRMILKGNIEEEIRDLLDTTFMRALGGDQFIVETEEDLKQIETASTIKDGVISKGFEGDRWANITEPADCFDICDWLTDDLNIILSPPYMIIWNATNNAGGTGYLVPEEIALNNINIMKSQGLSNPKVTYPNKEAYLDDQSFNKLVGN